MKFNTYILLIQSIFSLIKLKNMKVLEILKRKKLLIKNFFYENNPINGRLL